MASEATSPVRDGPMDPTVTPLRRSDSEDELRYWDWAKGPPPPPLGPNEPVPLDVDPRRTETLRKRAKAKLDVKTAAADKAGLEISKLHARLEQLDTEKNVFEDSIGKIEAGLQVMKVRSASLTSDIKMTVVEKDLQLDMLMKLGAEIYWLESELVRLSSLAGEEGGA